MFAKDQIIEIFFKLNEFWRKFSRFFTQMHITDRLKKRETTLLTTDVSSISTSTKCVAI